MKKAAVFLALLSLSPAASPQQIAAVGPVQTAQANPAPPPPQPPQSPPPKPSTAAPGEDTGMAGQVAESGGVVLPTVGAVSGVALLGAIGVVAAGLAISSSSDDDSPSAATTSTR